MLGRTNDSGNRAAAKNYDFKIRAIGGSGSPLCSAALWPTHIQVTVVEVGIIQITAMSNDAARWQRSHSNRLAIVDNVAECLMFD
jgi:hypothetical protein